MNIEELKSLNFVPKLVEMECVEGIYVFGSRSRGEASKQSDLDIAVLCPDATREEWNTIREIIQETPILLKIDIVRLDAVKNPGLKKRIERSKVPLYVRSYGNHPQIIRENFGYLRSALKNMDEKLADDSEQGRHAQVLAFKKVFGLVLFITRRALRVLGIRAHSPLLILRNCFAEGWLEDRARWEAMYKDYLDADQGYEQEFSAELISRLPTYPALVREAVEKIKAAMEEERALLEEKNAEHA